MRAFLIAALVSTFPLQGSALEGKPAERWDCYIRSELITLYDDYFDSTVRAALARRYTHEELEIIRKANLDSYISYMAAVHYVVDIPEQCPAGQPLVHRKKILGEKIYERR